MLSLSEIFHLYQAKLFINYHVEVIGKLFHRLKHDLNLTPP